MTVRVRFAPSPTGKLHIGGARTALFNFLFARHYGGKMILRIEDTDRARSKPEYEENIIDALRWMGITWDEGPYYQSKRLDLYRKAFEELKAKGRVIEDVDRDGKPCWRFMLDKEKVGFDDFIHGRIERDLTTEPDIVIMRHDGYPTYNFACVVDDIDMNITHVIRGDDHIANTPKQVCIYRALGKSPPLFGHIPLIYNPDGTKMSKDYKKKGKVGSKEREEVIYTTTTDNRDVAGYLPDAFVNFIALLGWSPGNNLEIMTMTQMIELFTAERVGRTPARFMPAKLEWMNGEYMKKKSVDEILPHVRRFIPAPIEEMTLRQLIEVTKDRSRTLKEMVDLMGFWFDKDDEIKVGAAKMTEAVKKIGGAFMGKLGCLSDVSKAAVYELMKALATEHGMGLKEVAMAVRLCVTGRDVTPPIDVTVQILGKERTLARLRRVLSGN